MTHPGSSPLFEIEETMTVRCPRCGIRNKAGRVARPCLVCERRRLVKEYRAASRGAEHIAEPTLAPVYLLRTTTEPHM